MPAFGNRAGKTSNSSKGVDRHYTIRSVYCQYDVTRPVGLPVCTSREFCTFRPHRMHSTRGVDFPPDLVATHSPVPRPHTVFVSLSNFLFHFLVRPP